MEGGKARWEVERDRLNASMSPIQAWVFRQWWLYGVGGVVLTFAAFADGESWLLLPGAVAFLAAVFGYRHRE